MGETVDHAYQTAEFLRLKNRIDTILNNVLCDMKPGWDDSIDGFNKAWDVVRGIFQDEIARSAQRALTDNTNHRSTVYPKNPIGHSPPKMHGPGPED